MNLEKVKKENRLQDERERKQAFLTLYSVDSQKDLLEQFESKLTALKVEPTTNKRMKKENREKLDRQNLEAQYTRLLELCLEYSHAIFFLYTKHSINKNITAYRRVALAILDKDNVERAFSMLKRLRDYREPQQTEEKKEIKFIDSDCLALSNIESLRATLKGDLGVRSDQIEDKKFYIKIAIVALAIGANYKEIIEGVKYNNIYNDKNYIESLLKDVREYQAERGLSDRGIRNGVDKLKIPLSLKLKEKIGDKATHCRNFNHLRFLYIECSTSSTPN